MVVTMPSIVEVEYHGAPADLAQWAWEYVSNEFYEGVETSGDPTTGPVNGAYFAKLLEVYVIEDDAIITNERIILDEMIAPGGT